MINNISAEIGDVKIKILVYFSHMLKYSANLYMIIAYESHTNVKSSTHT